MIREFSCARPAGAACLLTRGPSAYALDEYIAAQPEAVRSKLDQVRATIRKAVPEAVEGIGYRMAGYKLHGKPMLYFAGFKNHYSLFAASGTFFASLEMSSGDMNCERAPSIFR